MSRLAAEYPGHDARTQDLRAVVLALGLAGASAVSLGVARFAYGLLLPSMRAELHWTYAQAGAMNTGNAVGYLAGALLVGALLRRASPLAVLTVGLALTAVGTFAEAGTTQYSALLGLRLLTGVFAAMAFVGGAVLAAQLGRDGGAASGPVVLGIYAAGTGAGIIFSGLCAHVALANWPSPTAWRVGWLGLGGVCLLLAAPTVWAGRSVPRRQAERAANSPRPGGLWPTIVAYTIFGAGYIGYMTFIVALYRAKGFSDWEITGMWSLLGLAALGSLYPWALVIHRTRGGVGFALILLTAAVGVALPFMTESTPATVASALLFGGSMVAVITAATSTARRNLSPAQWPAAMSQLTIGVAAGQCLGPIVVGGLADRGGLRAGLFVSAGLLAVAAVTALMQQELSHSSPSGARQPR